MRTIWEAAEFVEINRRGVVNEESHRKSGANHPDPEACVVSRETAIEALTGHMQARIELRINCDRSADAFPHCGRQHRRLRYNASASSYGLTMGLARFIPAPVLVGSYFLFAHRHVAGRLGTEI